MAIKIPIFTAIAVLLACLQCMSWWNPKPPTTSTTGICVQGWPTIHQTEAVDLKPNGSTIRWNKRRSFINATINGTVSLAIALFASYACLCYSQQKFQFSVADGFLLIAAVATALSIAITHYDPFRFDEIEVLPGQILNISSHKMSHAHVGIAGLLTFLLVAGLLKLLRHPMRWITM